MVRKLFIGLLVAAFMMTSTGCFGSFALTKKVYEINQSVGSKWVQSAVMWVFMILPVYEIAGTVDVVILNLLEFWTGNNPLAVNSGDVQEKIVRKDGELYRVEIGRGKVAVTGLNGSHRGRTAALLFDGSAKTCSLVSGLSRQTLCSFNAATVDLHYPDGTIKTFTAESNEHLADAF